jgi:hypothetical protein
MAGRGSHDRRPDAATLGADAREIDIAFRFARDGHGNRNTERIRNGLINMATAYEPIKQVAAMLADAMKQHRPFIEKLVRLQLDTPDAEILAEMQSEPNVGQLLDRLAFEMIATRKAFKRLNTAITLRYGAALENKKHNKN